MRQRNMREYFGKPTFAHYGKGDAATTSERVSLHKSVKNLVDKGLIQGDRLRADALFSLTEQGYQQLLKANKSSACASFVSFNEYLERVEEYHKKSEQRLSALINPYRVKEEEE